MSQLLLTRLPLYGPDLSVFAYFLRTNLIDESGAERADVADAHLLITALTGSPLSQTEGEQRLFIPLSKALLTEENLRLIPADRFVIVVDDAEMDDGLIDQLTGFAQKGHEFAVRNFQYRPEARRQLFTVRYLLVSAQNSDQAIGKVVSEAKRMDIPVIASDVADHETLKRMRALKVGGYMGEFLTKPDLINPVQVSSNRLIVYKLLEALADPDVNFDVLENLLAKDNRLSYKLLKVLNSPAYAIAGRPITSLRDIILFMGLDQLKSWATLIALTNIEDKPYELMVTTMLRAKMAERMAALLGVENPETAFMTGLLSTLDALLDREMIDVLEELPVSAAIKDALLQGAGTVGQILTDVLNYERGDWNALAGGLMSKDDYRRIYAESVIWASKLCSTLGV